MTHALGKHNTSPERHITIPACGLLPSTDKLNAHVVGAYRFALVSLVPPPAQAHHHSLGKLFAMKL